MIDLLGLIGRQPKENNFKKRMRLHQGWWRAFVLGEKEGEHPKKKNESICNTIQNGQITNKNFLTPLAADIVEKIVKMRNEDSAGLMDVDRLYNNLLSSQPLCFNFFAPLYADKECALKFIKGIYPEITSVTAVFFEFANKNNRYDNSAYDAAFEVMKGAEKGIIGIECKYTDTFSSKDYHKDEYNSIYESSKIYSGAYDQLTSSRFNQLFRNQLIGESFKIDKTYDFSYTALFCHQYDEEAISIANEYKKLLNSEQSELFKIVTYKDYFEILQKSNITWEMREYLMLLWARYCGLDLSKTAYQQLSAE